MIKHKIFIKYWKLPELQGLTVLEAGKKIIWTINLKSFEILQIPFLQLLLFLWTINLKSFEILLQSLLLLP